MSQDHVPNCDAGLALSDDQIRERAYDIWERHHRPEGFEAQFWLMAKRELEAERRMRAEPDAGEVSAVPAEEVTEPNPTEIGER
ncbi:DUF2934 domain-containing protein [Methylobacterium sp. SD21]|uniref:DUF2934 domain-containing protein n=1 Tax=Methylobacterium litchii TaxID=3138810 RepID=UPI00313B3D91